MNQAGTIWSAIVLSVGLVGCGSSGRHATQTSATGPDVERGGLTSPEVLDGFYAAQLAKLKNDPERAYGALSKALELEENKGRDDLSESTVAALRFELGRLDLQAGRVEAAWGRFENAVKSEPENRWYRRALADLALDLGQYKTAIKHYEWVADNAPEDHAAFEGLISAYTATGEPDKVLNTIDRMQSIMGPDPFWEELRNNTYELFGMQRDAIDELLARHAAQPDDLDVLFRLLSTYESLGMGVELVETIDRALAHNPQRGALHMLRAVHDIDIGQLVSAHASLLTGLGRLNDEDHVNAIQVCSRWLLASSGMPALVSQQRSLILALVEAKPKSAEVRVMLAQNLVNQGELKAAAEAYLTAADLMPNDPATLGRAVVIFLETDQWGRALESSEKGTELFPMLPSFHYFSALIHEELGRSEQVVEAVDAGWPLVLEDRELHLGFCGLAARAHLNLGESQAAWDRYETGIAKVPDSPWLQNNYAYSLAEQSENLERAVALAQFANENIPGDAAIEDTYAWVLFKSGQFEEAEQWIQRAIATEEAQGRRVGGTLLDHAGDIARACGRREEAVQLWERAMANGADAETIAIKVAKAKAEIQD
ncbi:MAG: tetratricopeptide repeat protein [Flavobacteriales bacterium]|nr:tetratricopeptide repeat protein [Flavobacteriales bacterium]